MRKKSFMTRAGTVIAAVAFFAGLFLQDPASAQESVWLGVSRTGSQAIEVAVPDMQAAGDDKEGLGKEAARIVNFDLKATGYFKMVDNQQLMKQALEKDLKAANGIAFDEWRTLASNFVVKGNIGYKPGGAMFLDTRVYDVQTKKLYFSVIYTATKNLFRQMVHQFSDDMLSRLTGEQGVAKTRMAILSKAGGRKELFVMDYDGAAPTQITYDKSLVLFPHWNPKRDIILFTTYKFRNPDLYAVDIKNGARIPISRRLGLNSAGEWSPDGGKIVFSISKAGHSNIFICNADGSGLKQLTSANAIATSPSFSPDGGRIAFTSDKTGAPQIYVMNTGGGEERRITWSGSYNDEAEWSPKGDYIAYSSLTGPNFKIGLVNVNESRDARIITSGAGSDESPSWSPNGRNIAFSSSRSGSKQIYIINPDGSNVLQVTNMAGGAYSPSWGTAPAIERK